MGLIEALTPDVYAKGGDHHDELLAEAPAVRRYGGEVRILDYVPDRSTSATIERIPWRPAMTSSLTSRWRPLIDVLVPTRNRPTELAATLAGLAAQDEPFNVIVSDQSDGPASFGTPAAEAMVRVLRTQGRRVELLRHLPRRGLAEQRAFSARPLAPGRPAARRLAPGEWRAYKIAWVGGCVLFDRAKLVDCGGFDFWPSLPAEHVGEDVAAQLRVLARHGGAGIIPSGAIHLESPTTMPVREVDAPKALTPTQLYLGA